MAMKVRFSIYFLLRPFFERWKIANIGIFTAMYGIKIWSKLELLVLEQPVFYDYQFAQHLKQTS